MKKRTLTLWLLAVVCLIGFAVWTGGTSRARASGDPPTPGSGQWPEAGHDLHNTNASETDLGLPLELKWRATLGHVSWAEPPIIQNGVLYVGNQGDGSLKAIDPHSGTVLWSVSPGSRAFYSPTWFDGVLYCAASNPDGDSSTLMAIDPATGATMWSWQNDVGCRLSRDPGPKVLGDLLIMGTVERNAGFIAINRRTHATEWYWGTGWSGSFGFNHQCAIAEDAGLVISGLDVSGTVYAVDAATGAERWRFMSGHQWNMVPAVVVEDRVCFGVGFVSKHVFCLDVGSGRQLWDTEIEQGWGYISVLSASQGKVVCRTTAGQLVALDIQTGREVWRTGVIGDGQPIIAGSTVYCTGQGALHAFDLQTGREIGSVPDVPDGWLVAGAGGIALRTWEGDLLWFEGRDMTPPTVTCSVGGDTLWPPNHDLVDVGFTFTVIDNRDPTPTVSVEVWGDEDDEEPTGDGIHSPDARYDNGILRLRSERKGDADGRVYLIIVRARDASGNVGTACCTVVVPLNQSKSAIAAVNAQAAAAEAFCVANGTAPPGYFLIGDGPPIGPKQ